MRKWRACRAPFLSCSSSWKTPVSSFLRIRGLWLEQDPAGLHLLLPAHQLNRPPRLSKPAHSLNLWAKTTGESPMDQVTATHPRGVKPLHLACIERSAAPRKTFPCPQWSPAPVKLRPNCRTTQRRHLGVRLQLEELADLWVSGASWVQGTRVWTLRQAARRHWLSTRMTRTPPPTPTRTRLPWWPRAPGLQGHVTLKTAWTPAQATVQLCNVHWHVPSFFFYTIHKQGNKCIVCNTALLSRHFLSPPFAHGDASVTFVLLNMDNRYGLMLDLNSVDVWFKTSACHSDVYLSFTCLSSWHWNQASVVVTHCQKSVKSLKYTSLAK